jgi:hypothetical protein
MNLLHRPRVVLTVRAQPKPDTYETKRKEDARREELMERLGIGVKPQAKEKR